MAVEDEVNAKIKERRQGDVVADIELPFLHAFDAQQPITPVSKEGVANEPADKDRNPDLRSIGQKVIGFAILTQTCDLVRDCQDRPYAEIAPLIEVSENFQKSVLSGHRTSYVSLPPLVDRKLVVDLERVMTVEKAVLSSVPDEIWTKGCETDEEIRQFATALARKRSRFAFPDDFVEIVRPLQKRVLEKHGKNSDEGKFLAAIQEIRVRATPSWNDERRELSFYFIFPEDVKIQTSYHEKAIELMNRLNLAKGQEAPEHLLISIAQMTALLYLTTDPLDLDHLSN